MWTYFSISASAWGQARSKLGGVDTSILHHAFISIFIALWAVITHYISILMAILTYFTRFTMERGNAGSWNSGWKRSKYWKPILHSSKNPETPRKSLLELIRIIERRKHKRGPTPWPGGWGRTDPYWVRPLSPGPPGGPLTYFFRSVFFIISKNNFRGVSGLLELCRIGLWYLLLFQPRIPAAGILPLGVFLANYERKGIRITPKSIIMDKKL